MHSDFVIHGNFVTLNFFKNVCVCMCVYLLYKIQCDIKNVTKSSM